MTGASFGGLSPVRISRLPLSSQSIPFPLIPQTLVFDSPFGPIGSTDAADVFGVRTHEGRFAKVRAWIDVRQFDALQLEWTTYDTAIPQLDLAGRWSVVERGPVTESITSDCSVCRTSTVRRRACSRPGRSCSAFRSTISGASAGR